MVGAEVNNTMYRMLTLSESRALCSHVARVCCIVLLGLACTTHAAFAINMSQRNSLEQGTILYQFYQKEYFEALVEDAYLTSQKNPLVISEEGVLLKGGMLLSYGLPDEADKIFTQLLKNTREEKTKNSAWYYLAKLYYSKFDHARAKKALNNVDGKVPRDINIDYHYLVTLLDNDGDYLDEALRFSESIKKDLPEYPYFLFNFAVSQLRLGNEAAAIRDLEKVISYAYLGEEYEVLADRCKHALALISTEGGDLLQAWNYLTTVRTTGLYSNRALLSYAWSAIRLKNFNAAVPALKILDERSIALPEVQESKVLLAHLYEQEGSDRKALKQNILAEKSFAIGLDMVSEARKIIAMQDVPREFITNLDVIVRNSDWYGERPEVDYKKLTPFLIDLLASNSFQESLKELADLYAIEKNLNYWLLQTEEHRIIVAESNKKVFTDDTATYIARSESLKYDLEAKKTEFKLLTSTLKDQDKARFSSLLETTDKALAMVNRQIKTLNKTDRPYVIPAHYDKDITEKQQQIRDKLVISHNYVMQLEKVIRKLVGIELDKHESRIRYYWAQSRLAKARLYDAALTTLDKAQERVQSVREPSENEQDDASDKKSDKK